MHLWSINMRHKQLVLYSWISKPCISRKIATFMSRSKTLSRSKTYEPPTYDHPPIMVLLHDKWTAVVPYETWETILALFEWSLDLALCSKVVQNTFPDIYHRKLHLPGTSSQRRQRVGAEMCDWQKIATAVRNGQELQRCKMYCLWLRRGGDPETPECPQSEDDFTYTLRRQAALRSS